ncbi:MAG: uncharacterized protein KVP18_000573 [Porospora cf. gigantea A]|uniref:uncharacterized protein n=1 Tax=Porospora cf. gigantea A TaxID=2853593 RepID=UPI00355AB909|nr:MAG: hypothetical protein KVP18_000573 [Porospora cf. gigantea A]
MSQKSQTTQNPLVKRVIGIFDTDNDGKVSFIEFLVGLSKLASGTEELFKIQFAFDIYDMNRDGFISNGELFKVMKMMIGNNLSDKQLQQLVDRTMIEADTNYDGRISFMEFQEMCSHMDIADKLKIQL